MGYTLGHGDRRLVQRSHHASSDNGQHSGHFHVRHRILTAVSSNRPASSLRRIHASLQPTESRLHPNAAPRIKLRGLSSNVVRAIVSATRVYDSRCGRRAGMRSQTFIKFISSMSTLRICQSLPDEQLCLTGTGVSMIC
jgi:hypothetical protein